MCRCNSRLEGSTTFTGNEAYTGGAIYNDEGDDEDGIPASTTTYPDDTIFEGNEAAVSLGGSRRHALQRHVRVRCLLPHECATLPSRGAG